MKVFLAYWSFQAEPLCVYALISGSELLAEEHADKGHAESNTCHQNDQDTASCWVAQVLVHHDEVES